MAYQAIATGPISFLDPNSNQQEIPLSAIYFDANGPNASSWPNYSTSSSDTQKLINALLQELVTQGFLTPGTQTTPTPALTITATEPGVIGNVIQVTISDVSTTANTMTVAVSATEVYPALDTTTLGDALGTSAATASGLVYLESNNNQTPGAFTGNISAAPNLNCAIPEAADATKTAFTVAAANTADAADAVNIGITVASDAAPNTFTLTASWKKSQTNVTLAMLTTPATNPFGLLVTFTGPAGGPLPAPGTVTLQGGSGASSSPAAPASASILSS